MGVTREQLGKFSHRAPVVCLQSAAVVPGLAPAPTGCTAIRIAWGWVCGRSVLLPVDAGLRVWFQCVPRRAATVLHGTVPCASWVSLESWVHDFLTSPVSPSLPVARLWASGTLRRPWKGNIWRWPHSYLSPRFPPVQRYPAVAPCRECRCGRREGPGTVFHPGSSPRWY